MRKANRKREVVMYERMKCSEGCKQNWADKGNAAECRCPCHAPTPDVVFKKDAPLYVWNFRLGEMVDITTHNVLERMVARQ